MRKFGKRDLDRSWSTKEIATLSEGELTKLAFLRDYKNLVFFLPAAFVLYFIGGGLGLFGKVLGWIGIVMFGIFALQGLFNTAVTFVSLIGTPFFDKRVPVKNAFWKSLQLLISFGNFAIYSALALLVYAGIYDLKVQEYIPWW
jgi:hypothetical protein